MKEEKKEKRGNPRMEIKEGRKEIRKRRMEG